MIDVVHLFANGVFNPNGAIVLAPNHRVVAADGGARHALSIGLPVHTVVGDLDSLDSEIVTLLEQRGTSFERHPTEKSQGDLELALIHAIQLKPKRIICYALQGARLDYSVANILLLARYAGTGPRLCMFEGSEFGELVRGPLTMELECCIDQRFSIVPLSPIVSGVSIQGARWELDNAQLSLGDTLSLSNYAVSARVRISVREGSALVVRTLV